MAILRGVAHELSPAVIPASARRIFPQWRSKPTLRPRSLQCFDGRAELGLGLRGAAAAASTTSSATASENGRGRGPHVADVRESLACAPQLSTGSRGLRDLVARDRAQRRDRPSAWHREHAPLEHAAEIPAAGTPEECKRTLRIANGSRADRAAARPRPRTARSEVRRRRDEPRDRRDHEFERIERGHDHPSRSADAAPRLVTEEVL